MQTIGEKRVGVEFNPTKSETIDVIKQKTAELINLCDSLMEKGNKGNPEKNRCLSIAMTKFETAAMYAVKSNFK